jgi:arabinose-5-phosphate isomerase
MDIKLIIFDFDGVFTDGKCYFDNNNNIKKYYNIKDGMALSLIKKNNIKCGLISSYSSKKEVLLNELDINNAIIDHLSFDYKYIGKKNKLVVLNEWLAELKYNYDDVAYIGDDINDIEIIKLVKFSGCPNDAVIECKNEVDYICNSKGGDGCVREFVDLIINNNIETNIIYKIKKEVNYQINNIDLNKINYIAEIILNSKGIIYFMGIGKSGNMAKHTCDILKSVSINTFYLDTTNALHGDIGTIRNNDIIIMFSKSGNTYELIDVIPLLKERKVKIIGVCCDEKSKFKELCDLTIEMPLKTEISGIINKIPTNSCMSQLLFCNILVSILKENISLDIYKENHPAGNIGNNLKKIKDCLITEFPKILLEDRVKLHDILLEMTKYKIGCCFFVNENNELIGILTDGDVRRLLINDENIKEIRFNYVNNNFYYEENINKYIKDCKHTNYIPLLNDKKIIGIINKFV